MNNQSQSTKSYKYVAFISFRHDDAHHARWLKKELLSYRLPIAMVKKYKNIEDRNVKPVFLYQDDNPPGELSSNISDAIRSSKYLIVICSKHTNENPDWIDREISYFLELGNSPDRILPLIVDNSNAPETELFPPVLQRLRMTGICDITGPSFYETGKLDRHKAFIRLLAGIHNIDPYIIEAQDKLIIRSRRIRHFIIGVVLGVLLLAFSLISLAIIKAPGISFSSEITEANIDDTIVFTLTLKNLSKEDSVKIQIRVPDSLEVNDYCQITDNNGTSSKLSLDIFGYEYDIADAITNNNMTLSFEATVMDEDLDLGENLLYTHASIQTNSRSYDDTVVIKVTPQGSNISDDIECGWGDNGGGRSEVSNDEYNAGKLDDIITFNRISDSKIGHEFNFVAAREYNEINKGKFHTWHANEIFVKDGKTYMIRMFIHNLCCLEDNNIAEDVRAWFSLPMYTGTQLVVNGIFESSNATPSRYWDSVVFIGDQDFYLEYINDSAALNNNIHENLSLPNEIITSEGALLGYDAMDGNIPGGYNHSCVVTIQVQAHYIN